MTTTETTAIIPTNNQLVPAVSPEDRRKISEYAASISLQNIDQNSANQFASKIQDENARLTSEVLRAVSSRKLDEMGNELARLSARFNAIDPKKIGRPGILTRLIKRTVASVDTLIKEYSSLETVFDGIKNKLSQGADMLREENTINERRREASEKMMQELVLYGMAAQEKIAEIDQLTEQETDKDRKNELRRLRNRLSRRMAELYSIAMSTQQSVARLILRIDSNDAMIELTRTTCDQLIPIWQGAIADEIGLRREQNVIELHQNLRAATTRILVAGAEHAKENALQVARLLTEPMISLETLRELNNKITSTVQELNRIAADGQRKWEETPKIIGQLNAELQEALSQRDVGQAMLN